MIDKYGTGIDPYVYPNTHVLKNKLAIHFESELELAERELAELAIFKIDFELPPYTLSYWCHLHKQLFGDIYDWAGQIRTIDISKGNTRFCNVHRIEIEVNKIFEKLAQENYLADYERSVLTPKLAEYYSELNVIHPFREGNGRAQRLLFEHLIINCGYQISFASITAEQWLDANVAAYFGNEQPLVEIFDFCINK